MEVEGNTFPSISEDLIISFKYIFGKEPTVNRDLWSHK